MSEERKFTVERRTSDNERPSGWLVREEDYPGIPWEVVTLIADENWDGDVFEGGNVRRAGSFDNGRARFVCDKEQEQA